MFGFSIPGFGNFGGGYGGNYALQYANEQARNSIRYNGEPAGGYGYGGGWGRSGYGGNYALQYANEQARNSIRYNGEPASPYGYGGGWGRGSFGFGRGGPEALIGSVVGGIIGGIDAAQHRRDYYPPQNYPQQRYYGAPPAPHAQNAPMDIRPDAQRNPAQPQQGGTPITARDAEVIREQLGTLNRTQILALQNQLEQHGYGASKDPGRYSAIDGVMGPKTLNGVLDAARDQGLNAGTILDSMKAWRDNTRTSRIEGGTNVASYDDVRASMARNADATIRISEARDRG